MEKCCTLKGQSFENGLSCIFQATRNILNSKQNTKVKETDQIQSQIVLLYYISRDCDSSWEVWGSGRSGPAFPHTMTWKVTIQASARCLTPELHSLMSCPCPVDIGATTPPPRSIRSGWRGIGKSGMGESFEVLGKRAGFGNRWALGCSHKKNGESTLQHLGAGQQAASVGEACRRERCF